MAISFAVEEIKFDLKEKKRIKQWISTIVKNQKKRVGEIGYLFCGDEYLLTVNQEYLNHDTYTDIITFDYVEGNVISGDIMISVERVQENAAKFGVSFERELHRVIIHGVLHLLGNADKSDAEAAAMRQKEDEALSILDTIQ